MKRIGLLFFISTILVMLITAALPMVFSAENMATVGSTSACAATDTEDETCCPLTGAHCVIKVPDSPQEPDELTEEMATQIWLSPERKHLDRVRIEGLRLMDSALGAGVPTEALVTALKAALKGDAKSLESLLFADKGEAEAFYATQASAYDALMSRFPILSTINNSSDGSPACSAFTTLEQRVDALFSLVSDGGGGFDKLIMLAESGVEAAAPCGGWGRYARNHCMHGSMRCSYADNSRGPFLCVAVYLPFLP